ncbi:hypothetical protein HPB50_001097 [Hyalomma asiaticum]|uniref:Uncharacterized protein n=1 Tax=Hyalomma asiaticum TaxID=266040 RepID=A0ACB7TAL2_HYAAI|nr:hypothetical protein HPB50_001097 [Hyalomma asiaticum]
MLEYARDWLTRPKERDEALELLFKSVCVNRRQLRWQKNEELERSINISARTNADMQSESQTTVGARGVPDSEGASASDELPCGMPRSRCPARSLARRRCQQLPTSTFHICVSISRLPQIRASKSPCIPSAFRDRAPAARPSHRAELDVV